MSHRLPGPGRFLLTAAVVGLVHFGFTLLSIYNGFIIFRSAVTHWEVFWETTMDVMLFPADVLITGVADQWVQTLAVAGNSLLWGCVLTAMYYSWRAMRRRSGNIARPGGEPGVDDGDSETHQGKT